MTNVYGTRTINGQKGIEDYYANPIPYKTNTSSDGLTVYSMTDSSGYGTNPVRILRYVTSTEIDGSKSVTVTFANTTWANMKTLPSTAWAPIDLIC